MLATRTHIRWMIRRDMPEVLEIECLTRESGWDEEDFYRILRQRNCIGIIAESENKIVGFMVYELQRNGVKLMNFAIHPEFRRLKVGTRLLEKLKGKLVLRRRTSIRFDVGEGRLPLQLFLRDSGFLCQEIIKDDPEPGDVRYSMIYHIPETTITFK